MRSRSTVRVMRGVGRWLPCPISLSVSDVGTAATAPTPARARVITASIVPRLTNGRTASWMRMIVASSGSASSPARTESTRCAPPGTNSSRSPRSLPSQSGGRSAYPGGSATTTWRTSGWPGNGRSARSSIGTPRIDRNCLGSPGPARTPAPAATTTTPTSGCETTGELTDSLQPDHLQIAAHPPRARRQEHTPKALACRFGEPPLDAGNGANLAAEADLTEEERIGGHGTVVDSRDEGRKNRQVGRGLDQTDAAGHVDEDVQIPEREATAALEYREQQREAAMIESRRHALRRPESRLRGERLDFDQHRARPFHQRRDRRARCPGAAAGEKRGGGVRDRLEPCAGHPEDADLIDRAEAILHGAQDAVIECRFAFEIQDGIHDVLEGLRAGDAAAFGHVADEHDRGPRLLGEAHQAGRAFAHLAHVAGRTLELFGVGGLDGVEQHDPRLQLCRVMENRFEARFTEHVNAAGILFQAIGAQPELIGRLLTRDVERRDALAFEPRGALHEQRGFADPRLAADEHDGTRDDAATEDEVEFREARLPARDGRLLEVG